MKKIGIISDTHGYLPPPIVTALAGVNLILHAGDIGGYEILSELSKIAPVVAVKGNTDRGAWANQLPRFRKLRFEDRTFLLIHDRKDLDPALLAGVELVVHGHTHRAQNIKQGSVRWLNPGSASRPRDLSARAAMLELTRDQIKINFICI